MMYWVHLGIYHSTTAATATNTASDILKSANSTPSASTVPKSVMKQAASSVLPMGVLPSPPSIITAYTTATEVVDSAIPAIHAWWRGQPSTNCANSHTPRNGNRNESIPMLMLARRLARSETG